jgi:hypothetical protein
VFYSICKFYMLELFIFFSNNLSFGCWQLQIESTLPGTRVLFLPVLWIEILVRIRILGSRPLTYGSGSGSCFFRH